MDNAFDIEVLNAALKKTSYAIISFGEQWHSLNKDTIYTWTELRVGAKVKPDEGAHCTHENASLWHVLSVLQGTFPSKTFRIFRCGEETNAFMQVPCLVMLEEKKPIHPPDRYT